MLLLQPHIYVNSSVVVKSQNIQFDKTTCFFFNVMYCQ